MVGDWDLNRVERAFASAAVDPSRWNEAMDVVSSAVGAFGAVLLPQTRKLPHFPSSHSLERVNEVYVKDNWLTRDARDRAIPEMANRGVATDDDVMPADKHGRHPYYQELLAPFGLRWFAGVRVAAADDAWTLSIQRSIAQGPFTPDEVKQLAGLSTRLGASAMIARALNFAKAEGASAAFEASNLAAIQISRNGEAVATNSLLDNLLGPDLKIINRRLVSADRAATLALDRALHDLLWHERGSLGVPVSLPRRGRRPLLAYPMLLSRVGKEAFSICHVMLVIVDPEYRSRPDETVLQQNFGLSRSEARLAAFLSLGAGLDKARVELGVGKETLRTQLKAIFTKLCINSQSELVAILSSLSFKKLR